MAIEAETLGTKGLTSQERLAAASGVVLLPEGPPRFGAVTRWLMVRTALLLLVLFAAGTVLTFGFSEHWVKAVGLSLILPGGGLLYGAEPLIFAVAVGLFWLALILWWGASAVLAPWIVMAGAALAAGELAAGPNLFFRDGTSWGWAIPVIYGVYALALGSSIWRFERRYRRKVASIPATNAYLATATPAGRSQRRLEPDAIDSEYLKWVLQLGLQPVDRFDGFDFGEQLHGGTCLRYQLNMLGSALAMAHVNLLPNYPELVSLAQENAVLKNTDIRSWRFWRTENILGNFDFNPDPIIRDNIMLSGFLANQIGEMESATGSTRFDGSDSLQFVWRDGRVFSYSHESLVETLTHNYLSSQLGLFPCEPGWVFAACNAIGAEGVKAHDVLHGTHYFDRMEPVWRAGMFGEMMTADGAIRHIRSTTFGITFRDGDNTGEYYTTGFHGFVDTAPDMARRGSLLQLRGVPEKLAALNGLIDADGRLPMHFPPKRERSTRYLSSVLEWFGIAAGAAMVGNQQVADAAWRSMERDCATGRPFPDPPLDCGTQTLALALSTRWGSPLTTGQLVQRGYVPPVGPVLQHAPWPDVLVSKARCDDGVNLDLVIEPFQADAGTQHELTFRVEQTGRPHRLVGADIDVTLQPDEKGLTTVAVPITGRTSISLRPS